jgi:hypothetical protein
MTGEDLRILIRSEVLADEPPLGLTSAGLIDAAQRAHRRRRLTIALPAAAAVAVAATLVGAGVSPNDTEGKRADDVPATAQEVLDNFDPATFPAIVDSEVRRLVGDAIPTGVEGRIEPTLDGYTRLRPRDYAYTDSWTAWYDLSQTDQLMIILRQDQSANEGSAERYCEENLAAQEMERCTADTLADGSVAITSVSELRRSPKGFTRPNGDPDSRWYMRQVVNRRDYGFGVIAREYVKAITLSEADTMWSISADQLTEIANSHRLVYAMPVEPKKDCNTTFLTPRQESGYAKVVCERSLNN